MSSRRKNIASNLFSQADAQPSAQDLDRSIYGDMFTGLVEDETIAALDIYSVYPDPAQPRRTLPSAIRGNWTPNPDQIGEFLGHWINQTGITPAPYFSADEYDRPEYADPVQMALVNLLDLAANIRRHGLANPITVTSLDGIHRLETGERRWLAYHTLHLLFPEESDWEYIPARVTPQHSVWRQASENTARANLNAVGRARQLALLLMDLLAAEKGAQFLPLSDFADEQSFYAQVADGEAFRVPRSRGEQLLNALGLSHPKQIRDYRALLRLPSEVWRYADDHNLTEGEIRKLSDTAPRGTVSRKNQDQFHTRLRSINSNGRKIVDLLQRPGALDGKQRERALMMLDAMEKWMQDWIDEARSGIENKTTT